MVTTDPAPPQGGGGFFTAFRGGWREWVIAPCGGAGYCGNRGNAAPEGFCKPSAWGRRPFRRSRNPRAEPVAAARSAAGPAARIRPPYEPCNRPQKSRTAVTGSCPRTQQCGFPKRLCGSVLFQCLKDACGLQLGAQQPHQQVGDHHGKNCVDAAGQHLGGGGDKCRRKGAPAKAQHGDAFADV